MLAVWDSLKTIQLVEVTRIQNGIMITVDRTCPDEYAILIRTRLLDVFGDPKNADAKQLIALISELLISHDNDGSLVFEGQYDDELACFTIDTIMAQGWFKALVSLVEKARGSDGRAYTQRKNHQERRGSLVEGACAI